VIQYVKNQGFFLIDLDSTNGSFINGEPVHGRMPLRDGDRVRLSSLAFSFFLCKDTQVLDETPPDILAKLEATTAMPTPVNLQQPTAPLTDLNAKALPPAEHKEATSKFWPEQLDLEELAPQSSMPQLSPAQQSEILDRFFNRQIHKVMERN
jgi:pSer/pThr/pTyr-binding forkhead associated (FHA) protein